MSSSFSPLDMLDMQDTEQDILRCLNRQPGLTVGAISKSIGTPVDEIEAKLRTMISRSQIVEQLQNGQRVFSVRFSKLQSRMLAVPTHLLDILQEKPDTFLEETPLTVSIPAEEQQALLSSSTVRHLMPNEITIWQGDQVKEVALVRVGLIKKSCLKKSHLKQTPAYVRRSEWFGLSEVLSGYPSVDTFTAVTDTELLCWPAEEFANLLCQSPHLSASIHRYLSQQLLQCQHQRTDGTSRLWVIDSAENHSGATTFAVNLGLWASRNGIGTLPRVLLWSAHDDGQAMRRVLGIPADARPNADGIVEFREGIHMMCRSESEQYPPQVQVDILLGDLRSRYDYIVCDTGSDAEDEFLLRLRGQAEPLVTLTCDANGVQQAQARWNIVHPYARPAQKRMLALNQLYESAETIDAAFHLVLPYDPESAAEAESRSTPLVDILPQSTLSKAYLEAVRRLSLDHVIGIFVPSTMDVDQAMDNRAQVQSALSFFGGLFGGATSTDAEGVWQSDEGNLVVEQITIVRAFVSKKALEHYLDDVIAFATNLKKEMRQEAVAVDIDNQLILV